MAWIALGRTAFYVGPSEWDDNLYCDVAAVPRHLFEVANRYVHIWTLRLFNAAIESRRDAASWYATLVSIGLSWAGFFLGRRCGGPWCGVIAAALMPLYPALLWYMSVPYPDPPMAMWGAWALVCSLAASDATSVRRRMMATVAAGLFCFLSVKCKETGLAILPSVAVTLWWVERKPRTLALWLIGALGGWLLLSAADAAFVGDFFWSWRPSSYFPKPGEVIAKGTVRDDAHYLDLLLSTEFLAFSLLGTAGVAAGFRANRTVRVVGFWAFAALAFSSLVSCRYMGLHALDRYCVAMGVPLVVLSAYWITRAASIIAIEPSRRSIGWLSAVLITGGVAFYGLALEVLDKAGPYSTRFDFFMMPVAFVVLFLAPWLAGRRRWVHGALGLMVLAAGGVCVKGALDYVERKRQTIGPWVTLARAMDDTGRRLARWNVPEKPYARFRIERRCRSLSSIPGVETLVRDVTALEEIGENEWLFSTPQATRMVQAAGWRPFLQGAEQGGTFMVFRREGDVER